MSITLDFEGRTYSKHGGTWTHKGIAVPSVLHDRLERTHSAAREDYPNVRRRFEEEGIHCLFHVTDESNIEQIRQLGLLSRRKLEREGLPFRDIADPQVLKKRESFFGYVPLYLVRENPLISLQPPHSTRILEVSLDVLDLNDVRIAPRNAAIASVVPTHPSEVVDEIDWAVLRGPNLHRRSFDAGSRDWDEWKARRMAEVLVRDRIPPRSDREGSGHLRLIEGKVNPAPR